MLEAAHKLMWEHDGKCACGRRTFLFGQCLNCLEDDRNVKIKYQEQQARDVAEAEAEAPPPQGMSVATHATVTDGIGTPWNPANRTLVFVTNEMVLLAAKKGVWNFGNVHTQEWKQSTIATLPGRVGLGFRIAFAMQDGEVLPLQQCVAPVHESAHEVNTGAWFKGPTSTASTVLPGMVQQQLVRMRCYILTDAPEDPACVHSCANGMRYYKTECVHL